MLGFEIRMGGMGPRRLMPDRLCFLLRCSALLPKKLLALLLRLRPLTFDLVPFASGGFAVGLKAPCGGASVSRPILIEAPRPTTMEGQLIRTIAATRVTFFLSYIAAMPFTVGDQTIDRKI